MTYSVGVIAVCGVSVYQADSTIPLAETRRTSGSRQGMRMRSLLFPSFTSTRKYLVFVPASSSWLHYLMLFCGSRPFSSESLPNLKRSHPSPRPPFQATTPFYINQVLLIATNQFEQSHRYPSIIASPDVCITPTRRRFVQLFAVQVT